MQISRLLDSKTWQSPPPLATFEKWMGKNMLDPLTFWDANAGRHKFLKEYAYAIPCAEALDAIAANTIALLEVGAGTGFWSSLLSLRGVNVKATNKKIGPEHDYGQGIGRFFPVITLDASWSVTKNADRDVLMVWPCYDNMWAYSAARKMEPGRILFYVGEGHSGCTANEEFHDYYDEAFKEIATVQIPQFDGMHDALYIRRKLKEKKI